MPGRNVQQVVHVSLDVLQLFHIGACLFIAGIGFPLLLQEAGIILTQSFHRGQLCDSPAVKIFLRCLVDQDVSLMLRPELFAA